MPPSTNLRTSETMKKTAKTAVRKVVKPPKMDIIEQIKEG